MFILFNFIRGSQSKLFLQECISPITRFGGFFTNTNFQNPLKTSHIGRSTQSHAFELSWSDSGVFDSVLALLGFRASSSLALMSAAVFGLTSPIENFASMVSRSTKYVMWSLYSLTNSNSLVSGVVFFLFGVFALTASIVVMLAIA